MQSYYFYSKGIITTRRVQQLLITGVLIAMAALAIRAFDQACVAPAIETIFITAFVFTYFREERRALHEPYSPVILKWNILEALMFVAAAGGYFMFALTHRYTFHKFYGYFNLGGIGLYLGIIAGEWLWHNSRLKQLDDIQRQRYWTNYKDNLLG